jgi:peptidyl-prolyl cis-trans isomerase-like 3
VPKTSENFLALCASGRYNGTPIHRIIKDFIMQTGAPADDPKSRVHPLASPLAPHTVLSTNTLQSSLSIYDGQPFEDEIRPSLRHNARGIVSMANKGPHTNGSQFFITFAPQPTLDGKNTVFGKVIDGLETLDAIEGLSVDSKGRTKDGKVVVEKVTVHANPLAP